MTKLDDVSPDEKDMFMIEILWILNKFRYKKSQQKVQHTQEE